MVLYFVAGLTGREPRLRYTVGEDAELLSGS